MIFDPHPYFSGRRGEALQKFLHLEIFWGFGTRILPAPGGSTLLIGAAAVPERAEAGPEKEGGRGIDKASSISLGLSPKPKALSR